MARRQGRLSQKVCSSFIEVALTPSPLFEMLCFCLHVLRTRMFPQEFIVGERKISAWAPTRIVDYLVRYAMCAEGTHSQGNILKQDILRSIHLCSAAPWCHSKMILLLSLDSSSLPHAFLPLGHRPILSVRARLRNRQHPPPLPPPRYSTSFRTRAAIVIQRSYSCSITISCSAGGEKVPSNKTGAHYRWGERK